VGKNHEKSGHFYGESLDWVAECINPCLPIVVGDSGVERL
jgi:hypothetical protein